MKLFQNTFSQRILGPHGASRATLLALLSSFAYVLMLPSALGQGFKAPNFGAPFGAQSPFGDSEPDDPVTLSAGFTSKGDGTGVLTVTAKVADNMHIFSVTQPKWPGAPKRTKIRINDSDQIEVLGPFTPNKDPHLHPVENQTASSEEHEGEVRFVAPIKFKPGVDPQNVKLTVKYNGQACVNGPNGSCQLVDESIEALYSGDHGNMSASAKFRPETLHVLLSGKVTRIKNGKPADGQIARGDKLQVSIIAQPIEGHHFYAYDKDVDKAPKAATLLAIEKSGGWQISGPKATPSPQNKLVDGEPSRQYEETVNWTYDVDVPVSGDSDSNTIGGVMLMLTCTDTGCDRPTVIRWSADVNIGQEVSGKEFSFVESGFDINEVKKAVQHEDELLGAISTAGGEWAGSSPLFVIPAAFLAGFILNFMPCVLPVIGLKVMSFMHQAGQKPGQVFLLNAVFVLGMISVFMVLAVLAIQYKLGWGEQFESLTFKIVMIAVVVVFGLSFFGVWEIPIPGFGGSGVDQKEGLVGAFFKGILTTILATPCTGPLLVPALVWATSQPPMLTYLVFASVGLGMGIPYIILGAMPKLTKHLPKPGPWMETFKKIMGFVMLGTAVFLAGSIQSKYMISLLSMLLLFAFACWWMGRTPMTDPLPKRMKAWGVSGLIGAAAIWFSFFFLLPAHELEYKQYTRWMLDRNLDEGRTVLVDFTADW